MMNLNEENNPSDPPVNLSNTRIAPTADNPHGYPLFDLRLIPTYTNNQLRHYHTSGAMLNVDKAKFKRLMEERKDTLEMIDWDGNAQENTPAGSLPPLAPPVRWYLQVLAHCYLIMIAKLTPNAVHHFQVLKISIQPVRYCAHNCDMTVMSLNSTTGL